MDSPELAEARAVPPHAKVPEPTPRDLMNLVKTDKPIKLGRQLSVEESDLALVKRNHPTDYDEQLSDVLSLYMKQSVRPSWEEVTTALWNMGDKRSAQKIADEYKFPLPVQPAPGPSSSLHAATVQIVVQQIVTSVSITVNLTPTEELGGGEGVTVNAVTATAVAIISTISSAAQSDSRLTAEESQSLQLNPQVTAENEEMSAATQFAEMFRGRGDDMEALIKAREESRDFAAEDEDPNEAIQSFLEVAALVLEIGPDGLGTFNCGRLIILFYLGYDICVSYLRRHGVTLIIQFVERLVSQLIHFLSRTGFFPWLFETGGWRCVVPIARTDRYFQGFFHALIIATAAAVAFSGLKKLLWNS